MQYDGEKLVTILSNNNSRRYRTRLERDDTTGVDCLHVEYGPMTFEDIDFERLQGIGCQPTTDGVGANEIMFNTFLETVYYSVEDLGVLRICHDGMYSIPRFIKNMDSLTEISLRGSRLWEADLRHLPDGLKHLELGVNGCEQDVMWQLYLLPYTIESLVLPGYSDMDWPPLPMFPNLRSINLSADRRHEFDPERWSDSDDTYEDRILKSWLRKYSNWTFDSVTFTVRIQPVAE